MKAEEILTATEVKKRQEELFNNPEMEEFLSSLSPIERLILLYRLEQRVLASSQAEFDRVHNES